VATTYVPERQCEHWINQQLEAQLRAHGWTVLAFPLQQVTENSVPTDYLLFGEGKGPVKLFGLQHKALYHNGQDHWVLDRSQHADLIAKFPWVYYCLSEIRSVRDSPSALHACRFVRPTALTPPRANMVDVREYMRWWPFISRFIACTVGVEVGSRSELNSLLSPDDPTTRPGELERLLVDAFVVDVGQGHAIHLDPRLRSDLWGPDATWPSS
jgi:hypothetical protein